jgi:hypothetical protein
MTNHLVRLYAAAAALAAFFLAWAGIAARPWVEQPRDPLLVALEQREQRLQRDARLVQQVVDRRWAAYRAALAQSRTQKPAVAAPAPAVRIVTVPPVVTTRSS